MRTLILMMTKRTQEFFEENKRKSPYVRLLRESAANLERLRMAYGMPRRENVLEYLIEQGIAGLRAAQGERR